MDKVQDTQIKTLSIFLPFFNRHKASRFHYLLPKLVLLNSRNFSAIELTDWLILNWSASNCEWNSAEKR